MPGAESNLMRPVNVESQDHQHRMVEEELIGKGMRKCLRNVDAGVENRRHEQSAQGTDETGGIHKGEESRPQAAVPGKSCIEDEENLDGAQMKRQMLQLHIRIADGAVGRGHQLYDTEYLDEFREHGAGAAPAQDLLKRGLVPVQIVSGTKDQNRAYSKPGEMISGEHGKPPERILFIKCSASILRKRQIGCKRCTAGKGPHPPIQDDIGGHSIS